MWCLLQNGPFREWSEVRGMSYTMLYCCTFVRKEYIRPATGHYAAAAAAAAALWHPKLPASFEGASHDKYLRTVLDSICSGTRVF